MHENGITTAADYARLTEQQVALPSGAVFLLRRPTLKFRLGNLGAFQSIAARAQSSAGLQAGTPASDEEVKAIVQYYYDVLCECCVQPRVSLRPIADARGSDGADNQRGDQSGDQSGDRQGADVLHPEQIQLRDALFIARWAGGEVDPSSGTDLAEFHRQRAGTGEPAAARARGGDMELPSERTAGAGESTDYTDYT
jgi:hypothetical protein